MTEPTALAQLRHLYQNMVNGAVRDTASAKRIAEGLLAPAIEALERGTPPAVAGEPVAGCSECYITHDLGACDTEAPVAQGDAEDAARYRFLAGHCRSTSEHWGGRWSIIVDGPAPKSHDSEDDFDEAVDAARKQGGA